MLHGWGEVPQAGLVGASWVACPVAAPKVVQPVVVQLRLPMAALSLEGPQAQEAAVLQHLHVLPLQLLRAPMVQRPPHLVAASGGKPTFALLIEYEGALCGCSFLELPCL